MRTLRNLSFVVMVTLFAFADQRDLFAASGCTITDGYNTTTVTGTLPEQLRRIHRILR